MQDQPLQEVQQTEQVKGKLVISLNQPTPMWATWIFRTEFIINKVLLFIIGASSHVSPEQVKEYVIWLTAVDMAVWGFGRFLGVKKEDFES